MDNTGLKGLFVTLYQRVVLSYKTTLIGFAVVALGVVADNFANSPNKALTVIASVIGGVLVFLKEKFPAPTPAS